MPRRFNIHMLDLLWGEREQQRLQAERAHSAVREAREKRDEHTARIKLTETRNRLNGWSA